MAFDVLDLQHVSHTRSVLRKRQSSRSSFNSIDWGAFHPHKHTILSSAKLTFMDARNFISFVLQSSMKKGLEIADLQKIRNGYDKHKIYRNVPDVCLRAVLLTF